MGNHDNSTLSQMKIKAQNEPFIHLERIDLESEAILSRDASRYINFWLALFREGGTATRPHLSPLPGEKSTDFRRKGEPIDNSQTKFDGKEKQTSSTE